MRNLQIVIEVIIKVERAIKAQVFYMPLQQSPSLLEPQELAAIFANLQDLVICNTKILSDLEALQAKDHNMIHRIGETLLKHVSAVSEYEKRKIRDDEDSLLAYFRYCSNQMTASKFLQKKRSEDAAFGDFLKVLQSFKFQLIIFRIVWPIQNVGR
jgi:hypothetical protein